MASTSSSSTDAKGKGKAFEGTLQQQLSPCPSSSSSSMVYDVFLNHRGCDVKEGLAKDIYDALNPMVTVFLDKEVLEYGASIPTEIENAMYNASLCIAIFSPKYAESSWCLDELLYMFKNETKIIPIFYNVEPSDLRWLSGVYGSAFSQHKKKRRCPAPKLEEWKRALHEVSLRRGYELKNFRDVGSMVESIVKFVLNHLKPPLEVAQYPVGLDEIVDDFDNIAFKSSHREHHVNVVGIVGMGGSGKTTLARKLYNRECLNIDRQSFISDVRDFGVKRTLHKLQRKLYTDLSKSKDMKICFDNVTEGKGILRTRLRSLRVLIVLDNVDHVNQIDALLPEKGIFAGGSLIVVTTRDLNVLQSRDISCIYRMKVLNRFHAKQLFCWHAFRQSGPAKEFEDLVKRAMESCGGLPLSLKVFGEQLYKNPKDYWVSLLDKIPRILPIDITVVLRISFDALDREEQQMFMDTACFFLGEEKNLAIEVWNGSGYSGLLGWETLLRKCLVELNSEDRITMHDHLRDMGRQIAMERPPCRLFPSSDLDSWRQRQAQERTLIRGIMETSTYRSNRWEIVKSSFDYRPLFKEYIELKPSSCGVQLLVAKNNEFCEEYARLSKELRWLRLIKCQHCCLPSWLSLENLRVLELYDAPNLVELWQDSMQQPPLQLRELIINLGREKRSFQGFPRSIGRLRHLKKLSSIGGNLQNLPKGFCKLQSLEHLELQQQHLLSSLPSRFGDLANLRHLNLEGCNGLKMLPDSFKQLKHLQYLNLRGCSSLTFTEHNADILENITNLEYLSFRGCKGLRVLPHHITKQAFLRELDLRETSLSELPTSIGQLQRLEVLKIGSEELESLPDSLGNMFGLTRLIIDSCSFRSLPESIGRLALLESINMFHTRLEYLPKTFGHLISLQTLAINISPIRELFFESEESSPLPRLKSISLSSTSMSTMLIPEDYYPSLERLAVYYDDFLEEISTLPRRIKTIILEKCKRLKDIAGIGSLRYLQRLTIRKCPKLAELPSVAEFASIEAICITDCKRLKDIAGIGSLRNLQHLIIQRCPELAGLPTFAEFASIKQIDITGCHISGKMEGLEQLTTLETLEVDTQWEVPGITSLQHAQGLRRLQLSADKIGAVEPCIKTLQKWPGEVTIFARALGGVDSVVKAFTASNLRVVGADHTWGKRMGTSYRLRYPKTCVSNEATIVCFVINCLSQKAWGGGQRLSQEASCATQHIAEKKEREGKWVWIRVASQSSFQVQRDAEIHLVEGNTVEQGLLATGEERRVKDVFYRVLDALKM